MKKCAVVFGIVLTFCIVALSPALAQVPINVNIGTQHFANGSTVGTGTFNTAVGGQPAPFNAFCGSDITANCTASWTFTYSNLSGLTISVATLTLGILDIDSAAAGNQVASFILNGTDDLTGALNAASEGLNGGAGAPNSQYDVLTMSIPSTYFTDLQSGTATFALTLQGPGLGVLGNTTDNGAGLDFSSLYIDTPEPTSWTFVLIGLLCIGIKLVLNKGTA